MFRNFFTTKRICRAGVIAALYVALTYAFAPVAFGIFQVRPAEALTILPLFFPEAIPALYVGCLLANLASPFLVYDLTIGPLVTLAAAICTYFIGVAFRRYTGKGAAALKVGLGGIFPVLFNAFVIPAVIVFLCSEGADATIAAYCRSAPLSSPKASGCMRSAFPSICSWTECAPKALPSSRTTRKNRSLHPNRSTISPIPRRRHNSLPHAD